MKPHELTCFLASYVAVVGDYFMREYENDLACQLGKRTVDPFSP